jgi:hypothetical protein
MGSSVGIARKSDGTLLVASANNVLSIAPGATTPTTIYSAAAQIIAVRSVALTSAGVYFVEKPPTACFYLKLIAAGSTTASVVDASTLGNILVDIASRGTDVYAIDAGLGGGPSLWKFTSGASPPAAVGVVTASSVIGLALDNAGNAY